MLENARNLEEKDKIVIKLVFETRNEHNGPIRSGPITVLRVTVISVFCQKAEKNPQKMQKYSIFLPCLRRSRRFTAGGLTMQTIIIHYMRASVRSRLISVVIIASCSWLLVNAAARLCPTSMCSFIMLSTLTRCVQPRVKPSFCFREKARYRKRKEDKLRGKSVSSNLWSTKGSLNTHLHEHPQTNRHRHGEGVCGWEVWGDVKAADFLAALDSAIWLIAAGEHI